MYTKEGAGGTWDSQLCLGNQTSCAKTWNFTKTTAGTYQYYGWVIDSDDVNGCASYHEAGTSPTYVTVTVTPACKSQGTSCSLTSECCAGSCVDGVCCNSSCTGTCVSCNLAGGVGVCSYIPAGQDPADECYGTGTCGGTCNNSGGCQYPAASVTCSSLQDCDYLNYYYQSGIESPSDTEYCYYRDYADTYQYCNGSGSCSALNCSSYADPFQYSCGTCKYISASNCTGGTSGSCSTYGDGTSCGTNQFCTAGVCKNNTQILATAYGTNSIFGQSSITLGSQVAVGGLLKTAGGTALQGYYFSLWDCTGACVQVTEGGMNSIGPTDASGYAGKYWTPSSGYQGTRNYLLLFGGDGSYNQSQTSNYSLTVTAACAAPGIPANPCSQQSAHAINFSWNAVSGATSYRVEWCNASYNFGDANCCSGTCYGVTSNTQYYAYGLNTQTAYKYRVRVEAATGCVVPGSWSSNQQCATLSQDVVDCNNECYRRGYTNPGDCIPLMGGYIPCGSSQSNYGSLVGKYGACSGLFVIGCVCCHDCPNPSPADYVSVGSCSTAITGKGWDATDGVIFGYRGFDKDGTWRSLSMDDNPGDNTCADDLTFKNSWTVSGGTITVQTDITGRGGTHSLGGGFDFNPGGCKYTVSKIGEAGGGNETYTNTGACMTGTNPLGITGGANPGEYVRWLIDMEYCGDGQCNCGETCTSCLGDCGACDIIPPTTTINIKIKSTGVPVSAGTWLPEGTYTVEFNDSDNTGGSGLKDCKYDVYSCNAAGTACSTPIFPTDTVRSCQYSFDILAGKTAPTYNAEGKRYRIRSFATDNAGNPSGRPERYLWFDFNPPTTEIK